MKEGVCVRGEGGERGGGCREGGGAEQNSNDNENGTLLLVNKTLKFKLLLAIKD